MHTLMSEEHISDSQGCIYCGCVVGKKSWKKEWDGAQQYVTNECEGCGSQLHFKLEYPMYDEESEKETNSLDAKIKIMEWKNKEP